uniref:Protein TBATA n=1 Tax=Knipowitschia caucasica TaxID=637954 RepID=A0AAV2LDY3_KNICA
MYPRNRANILQKCLHLGHLGRKVVHPCRQPCRHPTLPLRSRGSSGHSRTLRPRGLGSRWQAGRHLRRALIRIQGRQALHAYREWQYRTIGAGVHRLNGRPVCTVRDDWFVSSSLFPHPLLKANTCRRTQDLPLARSLYASSSGRNKPGLLSEMWRDELKELAARISATSKPQKDKKEGPAEDEPIRRQTQYSSETGRLIPASSRSFRSSTSSRSSHRRSYSRLQSSAHPQALHDQELKVLELLCQILQTDSLSTVQNWLLLSGQREKDLVMGMLKQALGGMETFRTYPDLPPHLSPNLDPAWPPPPQPRTSSNRPPLSADKPERIGEAEVFHVHVPNQSLDDITEQ